MKNRLEICDINRPGPRHGHNITQHILNIKCISM